MQSREERYVFTEEGSSFLSERQKMVKALTVSLESGQEKEDPEKVSNFLNMFQPDSYFFQQDFEMDAWM